LCGEKENFEEYSLNLKCAELSFPILTPKGLGVPYVGFSDSGQAAVNAF
jgi:hypothetical protein